MEDKITFLCIALIVELVYIAGFTIYILYKSFKESTSKIISPTTDIFEGATFGDIFVDRSGARHIYHYKEKHTSSDGKIWDYHFLMREPQDCVGVFDKPFIYAPYQSYVSKDGVGVVSHLKYYKVGERDSPNVKYEIVGRVNV